MILFLIRLPLYAVAYNLSHYGTHIHSALPTPVTEHKPLHSDWRLTLSRAVFAATLSECCILFILLILQAADIAHPVFHFKLSLYVLTAILTILIPHSTTLVLIPNSLIRSPPAILSSLIPVLLSLLALSYIPAQHSQDWLTRTLSRLILLGTTILGLLSGFGAVSRAWPNHNHIVPTQEEITAAEISLQNLRTDLQRRTRSSTSTTPTPSPTLFTRVQDTLRGGDSISLQLRGLHVLEQSMEQNIVSLRSQRASGEFSRTFRGRLWALVGRLFAVYCVARVITATFNLLSPRPQSQSTTTYPDIITNILIYILIPSTSLTPEFISSLTRHLSLLLIGLIVLSTINTVMRGVNRALKITSRRLGTSLILLFLAYLMGIYLLSTLVQLRSSFPPPPLSPPPTNDNNNNTNTSSDPTTTTPLIKEDINLFTLIPAYELFNSLFDSSFLLSAVLTTLVKWGVDRLSSIE